MAAKAKRQIGDFFISVPLFYFFKCGRVPKKKMEKRGGRFFPLLFYFLFPLPPFGTISFRCGGCHQKWRKKRRAFLPLVVVEEEGDEIFRWRHPPPTCQAGWVSATMWHGWFSVEGGRGPGGAGTARYLGGSRVCSPLGN